MEPLRRALPYAPGDWQRLSTAVSLGLAATPGAPLGADPAVRVAAAQRLQAALAPSLEGGPRSGRHLGPRLVFVTVAAADVALLGEAAHTLGAGLLPTATTGAQAAAPASDRPVLDRADTTALAAVVWAMALVHGLLDLDLGEDVEVLRYWGADGPLFTAPPPVALAAHRRVAARVYALWTVGRPT
jgi:hypothetical protein